MLRLLAVALVLTLPLSLAACGGSSPGGLSPVKVANPSASPDGRKPTADTFVGRVYTKDGTLTERIRISRDARGDDEWREQLTEEEFRILREQGTERAGTGDLLKNKKDGTYTCAACGLPLFTSDTKFESGTGWPSFFREIEGNVEERDDDSHGMFRVEILCARCEGHLGHVFRDGPPPTRLRYCVNSVSLDFTPQEKLMSLADPAADTPQLAEAVFAGGCFWCVEAVFEELAGVVDVVSGYAGDDEASANYSAVSSGRTKHAEAVKIVYDPVTIGYVELLEVHFATHDPTQLNRQGNDHGPQYRSAIFYANDEEKALAQAFIEDLQPHVKGKIVTTLEPLTAFYAAEQYHQNFVCNNPMQGYVRGVALPKVDKVRKQFKDKLKDESPLEK